MRMQVVWGTLLIGFAAVHVYAFAASDLAGLLAYLQHLGPWGMLATVDLLLALIIGVRWMWQDARAKGIAPLPYALLTAAGGSVGLLVYLVRHGGSTHHYGDATRDRASASLEPAQTNA
ncbi:MAG: hypothetical protein HY332_08005 [Chloroflexi bacterium]|nr:hypothetical protein [Chloroflexota bacterium]